MALVSGRPISFKMDLYNPLYVARPTVEPELFASLRPPTYSGAMNEAWRQAWRRPAEAGGRPRAAMTAREAAGAGRGAGRGAGGRACRGRELADGPPDRRLVTPNEVADRLKAGLDLGGSVAVAAPRPASLGDYFQYVIDRPVDLARQKSALLPIVNKDVEGKRVSIYNPAVQPKHPLLGLRFKNTTGMPLTQGPITVFEGSVYAGDTRVLDLQPDEERLVSYAIDLGTEVSVKTGNNTVAHHDR